MTEAGGVDLHRQANASRDYPQHQPGSYRTGYKQDRRLGCKGLERFHPNPKTKPMTVAIVLIKM